jgi:hypothetical protein
VAVAEIFLAVIIARTSWLSAFRATVAFGKLRALAGPAATGALDAIADAAEQFIERRFEGDGSIERDAVFREPAVEEECLGHATGKSVEHPAFARVIFSQPIAEDRAHQVIRQVAAAGEDGRGGKAERGVFLNILAKQSAGAEVSEA